MPKKVVFVFGNLLVKDDSLPLRIIDRLKKDFPNIEFRPANTMEDLYSEGMDIIIIDTVKNIDKVRVIDDVDSVDMGKTYSMHDFDLGHALKILKKMGMINSVKIFGVPDGIGEDEALKQLGEVLKVSL